jgi:hypothetical protein
VSRPGPTGALRLTLAPGPAQVGAPVARATPEPDRDQLRADVRHLVDQHFSDRAIASRLPVSRATVGRWRKEWEREMSQEQPDGEPPAEPDPAPAEPARTDGEPDEPPAEPDHLTGEPPGVPGRMDAPSTLAVALTGEMQTHLAVLAECGYDTQAAIELCLRFVSDAITDAWQHHVTPRGVRPWMRVQSIPPQRPWPPRPGPKG